MDKYQIPQTAAQKQAQKEQVEQKQAVLSHYLLPDARQRLERVSLVAPERAARVEAVIFQLAQTGQIGPQSVDEARIKNMLEQLAQGEGAKGLLLQNRVDLGVQDMLGDDDLSF
ncbi:Double-stranded DNA-binding domain-containing protein [Spironucleus salmonicida]|uniref:Double-stranded DNA-binding domain-containing protein n=1 Tax=Spironucleus salmonicida TaxID=348837 RepID=V6LGV7_9EUKA|nr:Double-stranded DNA-binding domain-containing protein [Spironucleus salmonicida]|eukprot:EST43747.1 hypothetical protein SS50377_16480 [Spironucleus salmonicida]